MVPKEKILLISPSSAPNSVRPAEPEWFFEPPEKAQTPENRFGAVRNIRPVKRASRLRFNR
jgi:hypothetical protein